MVNIQRTNAWEEDGSSLRRTHPLSRGRLEEARVVVASAACSPSPAKHLFWLSGGSGPQTPIDAPLNRVVLGAWRRVSALPSRYFPVKLRSGCAEKGKHVHLPFSYASAIAPMASVA